MSLKAVHISFIVLSIALAFGLGYWGVREHTHSGNPANLCLGIASFLGGGGLIYYLIRFIRKMKKLPPLLLLGAGFLFEPSAFACSVCFGDPHSSLSRGVVAGVLFLIGVITFVLGWIAVLIFLWSQKARKIKDLTAST